MIDRLNSASVAGLSTSGVRAAQRVAPGDNAAAAGVRTAPRSPVDAGPPPIDTARVAALRDAIASGGYPIDASAIAARMIASDLAGS